MCANNRSHSSYNLGRFIADMRELAGMAEGEVKAMSELVQEVREGLKEVSKCTLENYELEANFKLLIT